MDSCIFQGDGERAMGQLLRSVQQVRAIMGLPCEVRMTHTNQHASNGQAEMAVQNVRRMANCIRNFARLSIMGNMHIYPYAGFLLNRFRVLEKVNKTSYELATGHGYRGKLALFGESVMFKRLVKYKASDLFERGVWVGKHSWNDNHIVLSPEGAFEARTIRRLGSEEAFIATDIVVAKGLPWSYSPQGILMKHAGQAQRYRQPTLENEATEEEMKAVTDAVAAGVVTPAPGLRPQPTMPGMPSQSLATAVPQTPAPLPATPRKRSVEGESEGPERKRQDASDSPRKAHDKRESEAIDPGTEKKQKTEEEMEQEGSMSLPSNAMAVEPRGEGGEMMASSSPSNLARLYPPHYAGIQAIEAHGDEEVGQDLIPEEVNEEMFAGYGGNEDDEPPITSEEYLNLLDEQAKKNEVERMLKMPATQESSREEVQESDGYTISTKFVITWKHRLEKGGWFRRARLVARQFKGSVDLDQTFAPTSIMVLPKMLIHLMLNVFKHFRAMTLDIKDPFLMADQPAEERAFVELDGTIYKLIKCLPGQRTAASQWFQLFVGAAKKFGLEQDPMQPTLLMMKKEMYITVHVDDIFMVGNEMMLKNFVEYMRKRKGWNNEVKGPFGMNEKFHYLKREFWPGTEGCDIRCDYKQYESLARDTDVFKKA